jgi:hypothetical protein
VLIFDSSIVASGVEQAIGLLYLGMAIDKRGLMLFFFQLHDCIPKKAHKLDFSISSKKCQHQQPPLQMSQSASHTMAHATVVTSNT